MSTTPSNPSSSSPPAGGDQLVRNAIAALAAIPTLKSEFFDGAAATEIALSNPLATFTVGLSDLSKGLIAAAQLTSWRYLLSTTKPTQPLGTADLGLLDGKWQVAGVNRGHVATSTAETVAYAQTTAEWRAGGLELRVVQVSALYTVLAWLHGEGDWFLVIEQPEPLLKTRTLLDEATVMNALQELDKNYKPVLP